MNETIEKKHSKLGIASCVIALLTWFYLAVLVYLVYFNDNFTRYISDNYLPRNSGMADFSGLGTALVLLLIFFVAIPVGGHLTGLVFGFLGAVQRTKKKTFAVAGLVMNLLIFFSGIFFYIAGIFSGKS